jgi:hypothetical protein
MKPSGGLFDFLGRLEEVIEEFVIVIAVFVEFMLINPYFLFVKEHSDNIIFNLREEVAIVWIGYMRAVG